MSYATGISDNAKQTVEHVFRWDLDKTYLDTEFDRVADLVRTVMQKAEDKRTVPGAGALLRALLRPPTDGTRRAVTFISGSPRQMRRTLERKLELDGIRPDAFVLKPNLSNVLMLRLRAIRGQVGYKLQALLDHQLPDGRDAAETLFGDDAEQDAVIYSIYAEILAGRIRGDALSRLLDMAGVYSRTARAIVRGAQELPVADRVRRICIILDRKSPPLRFAPYGARLVPVYNYFQAALVLFQDGLLSAPDLVEISVNMVDEGGYNPLALTNSMQDVLRRGHLETETLRVIARGVRDHKEVGEIARRFLDEFAERLDALGDFEASCSVRSEGIVDYAALLDRELRARKEHKNLLEQAFESAPRLFR